LLNGSISGSSGNNVSVTVFCRVVEKVMMAMSIIPISLWDRTAPDTGLTGMTTISDRAALAIIGGGSPAYQRHFMRPNAG